MNGKKNFYSAECIEMQLIYHTVFVLTGLSLNNKTKKKTAKFKAFLLPLFPWKSLGSFLVTQKRPHVDEACGT